MFCNNCGKELTPGEEFCSNCGIKIEEIPEDSPEMISDEVTVEENITAENDISATVSEEISESQEAEINEMSDLSVTDDSANVADSINNNMTSNEQCDDIAAGKVVFTEAAAQITDNSFLNNSSAEENEVSTEDAAKHSVASTVGNILWFPFGLLAALSAAIWGLICCITIIGIPFGKQWFKIAKLAVAPFGKEIVYGGKTISFVLNIIWIVFTGGLFNAILFIIFGIILCITIIGIPLGKMCFKFAKLALIPFGSQIIKKGSLKS